MPKEYKLKPGMRVEITGIAKHDPNYARNKKRLIGKKADVVEVTDFVKGHYECTLAVSGLGKKSFLGVRVQEIK